MPEPVQGVGAVEGRIHSTTAQPPAADRLVVHVLPAGGQRAPTARGDTEVKKLLSPPLFTSKKPLNSTLRQIDGFRSWPSSSQLPLAPPPLPGPNLPPLPNPQSSPHRRMNIDGRKGFRNGGKRCGIRLAPGTSPRGGGTSA